MATISYGTITITDITDIINVYLEYCMVEAGESASDVESKSSWISPEVGWSTTYPTWVSGYEIWVRQVQQKEGINQLIYGTPYLDKAINQINENLIEYIDINNIEVNALKTKTKKIIENNNGITVVSSITGRKEDVVDDNISTYGFNTNLTPNSLNLRYNAVKFTEINTTALLFYYPKKDLSLTGVQYIQGESGVKLDVNGLKLYGKYNINQESDPSNPLGPEHETILTKRLAAELNQNGLNISNGSIVLGGHGTSGVNAGDIALSNQDFPRTINNTPREHLRMAIGSKFGVKNDGTLYAAGADVDGHITARSLIINGTDYIGQVPEIQNKASNSAEYEVVIKVSSIDYTDSRATLIAIPTKLGASTTGTFIWYKNAIGTPHRGTVTTTTNTDDTLTVTDLEALYIAVLQ